MPLKASLDIQVATGSLLQNPTVHKIQDVLLRAAGRDELPESNAEQDEAPSSSTLPAPGSFVSAKEYIDDALLKLIQMIPYQLIRLTKVETSPGSAMLTGNLVTRGSIADYLKSELGLEAELNAKDRQSWSETLLKLVEPHLRYAILSHRWGKSEPLLADAYQHISHWLESPLEDLEGLVKTQYPPGGGIHDNTPSISDRLLGIAKLKRFCSKVVDSGLSLAWSDTCCIDKTNNALLQESITSMFRWYRGSEVCIVHMADTSTLDATKDKWEDQWFTRGWTLQELLAPQRLEFYSKDWVRLNKGALDDPTLNDKQDDRIVARIALATKIPVSSIKMFTPDTKDLKEKLSWTSYRKTTVAEDLAYCLVGIFDVDLTIHYGEGSERAFYRLQEAIIKKTDDRNIFNWHGDSSSLCSIIAKEPLNFAPIEIPALSQSQPLVNRSFFAKVACSGFTCMGLCMDNYVSAAVRLDILATTGELANAAQAHFDITNNGVHLKTDTIRVLHKWRLRPKEKHVRWYLTVHGYQRLKVSITPQTKTDIEAEMDKRGGRDSMVLVPITAEKITEEAVYPRLAVLLFKVSDNTYKRVKTKDPIVLVRKPGVFKNSEIPHSIYIK